MRRQVLVSMIIEAKQVLVLMIIETKLETSREKQPHTGNFWSFAEKMIAQHVRQG